LFGIGRTLSKRRFLTPRHVATSPQIAEPAETVFEAINRAVTT